MDFYEEHLEYREHLLAITDQGEEITYGEMEEFSHRFGARTKSRGLVFILCANTPGALLGYLSCLKNHLVPLMLEKQLDEEFFLQLMERYHPDYIYGPQDRVIPNGAETEGVLLREYGYCLKETGDANAPELGEELALLLTTSGSTGSPKLVRQSRKNLTANALSIVSYLELNREERPITTLPMNYTYGLSIINSHVAVGAAILLTARSLVEREFWEFAKDAGATSMGGVPYTYEILKRIGFMKMDLPKMRTMTQAGGKLSLGLHREFAEFGAREGKKFIVMYGQTEATARMGYLPAEYATDKCGSMGISIPGGRFTLMDSEGNEIMQPLIAGELIYEGANVTLGYAKEAEDLKKGDEWHGILHTGDMAERDSDGFYYITGRKKRFIKIYGNRVNMDEIERFLKGGFEEADFACTGEDDSMVIYTDSRDSKISQRVIDCLTRKTHLNARAFTVKFIDKIPKNEAGKTIYRLL